MKAAWLIAFKDLRLLGRDRVALFWVFVFPVVFALFFSAVTSASVDSENGRPRGMVAESLADRGKDGIELAIYQPPIAVVSAGNVEKLPRSAMDGVFPAAILWGLMGCAATFAVGMVAERTGGTYLRLRVAPVSSLSLMAGKALACFLACVLTALVLLGIGRLAFDVGIDHPVLTVLAITCAGLCFVGITVALSVLGRTEQAVAGTGWATLILLAMVGGAMVPVALMPDWLATLSRLSPVRWGITALEVGIWRGESFADLAGPCAVLLGVGAFGFAIGTLMLKGEAA